MNCEYCHEYCRDCDGSRTHYISLKGMELVGCGCSGCCDRLGGSGPYLNDDDLSVFDDSPNVGLGSDGQYHNDPYCAAIAPIGTPEARNGELCGYCEKRRKEAAEAYFDARFDAKVEAAARNDRAFWGLG